MQHVLSSLNSNKRISMNENHGDSFICWGCECIENDVKSVNAWLWDNTFKISVHIWSLADVRRESNWFNGSQRNTFAMVIRSNSIRLNGPTSIALFPSHGICLCIVSWSLSSAQRSECFACAWLFYLINSQMWATQCMAWNILLTITVTNVQKISMVYTFHLLHIHIYIENSGRPVGRLVDEKCISHEALQWMWFIRFIATYKQ